MKLDRETLKQQAQDLKGKIFAAEEDLTDALREQNRLLEASQQTADAVERCRT